MIDKIKIGGIYYRVLLIDDLRDGNIKLDGCRKYAESEILIEKTLGEQASAQTLFHEILHDFYTQSGRDADEDTIDSLSFLLLQLLRDNPRLIELIVNLGNGTK